MSDSPASSIQRRAALGALAAAGPASGSGAAEARSARAPGHVVLLGDSVFDNKAYVAGGPDVVAQLRGQLPAGWRATLAAVDGAVASGLRHQLARLPGDASHLVVSAGGNDALRQEGLLRAAARSVGEGLLQLAALQDSFRAEYRAMLDLLLERRLPLAACTIYDPRFPDPARRQLATTGLALFNDVILREAFARGLPVLDLRLICNQDTDFANPIEPSVAGGAKIAAEIARLVTTQEVAGRPVVFTGTPGGGG
ncbi:SGNH/GDSL hydrolase family protein [Roseomonas sp. SSH11]|uniref:SGNH/GDSL hydrolase family protein n=1 Tax=Pararoseomonas baculiformis TaxID=2820812 RepID=A0ABS4ALZ9_9PROT|nr:SGNH/GDSL hydrolase family protein [Pararoseomonas baculiformis]MBP0447565.1 SGNH/GDSL hydrolase family protein [Pararoseomonas baculiformis]